MGVGNTYCYICVNKYMVFRAYLPRIFRGAGKMIVCNFVVTCDGHMWRSHATSAVGFRGGVTSAVVVACDGRVTSAVVFRGSSAVQVKWKSWQTEFHQSWCPPRCGFCGLTSAVVFRGSSADLPRIFRGASEMIYFGRCGICICWHSYCFSLSGFFTVSHIYIYIYIYMRRYVP